MTAPSDRPLVSVLMPSYNHARFVEQAVRSVWAQTWRPLELVVVDDGSPDESMAVLRRLQQESPIPFRLFETKRKGVCGALNLAVREAKGEYLSLLASDDAYREDKISKQMALMLAEPRAPMVHTETAVMDEHGALTGVCSSDYLGPPGRGECLRELLLLQADVRSVGILLRKSELLAVGGYDESLRAEDWQITLRLAARGPILHVDEPLVLRRIHGTNVTTVGMLAKKNFSMREEVLLHVLQEVTPPDLDVNEIAALHASISLRNAASIGAWSKLGDGLAQCLRAFPKARGRLAKQTALGALAFAWVNGVKPRLPPRAREKLVSVKNSLRQRFKL